MRSKGSVNKFGIMMKPISTGPSARSSYQEEGEQGNRFQMTCTIRSVIPCTDQLLMAHIGGSRGRTRRKPPPYGTQFFRFRIYFHQKAPTSEVHALHLEILDPPLPHMLLHISVFMRCIMGNKWLTVVPINISTVVPALDGHLNFQQKFTVKGGWPNKRGIK